MVALLLAVLTGILFSVPPWTAWTVEYGGGDEHLSASQHDIPVVSRQQEAADRFVRREDDAAKDRQIVHHRTHHDFDWVEQRAFVAWPLPVPIEIHSAGHVPGWYARGPPAMS